jgi:hypothetical protein
MLVPFIPIFRRRKSRSKNKQAAPPPPPGPLTLVSASYSTDGPTLMLSFDRAVNPSGLVFEALVVSDAQFTNQQYLPEGFEQIAPNTLLFLLTLLEPSSGSGVRLNAAEGNGLVAADDGQPWPGVSALPLPFP